MRLFLLLFPLLLYGEKIQIDLTDPLLHDHVLSTTKGGVIQTESLRVQAENITYQKGGDLHELKASGNLLILFNDKFFIGDKFTYDFASGTGHLSNGVGSLHSLFIGGSDIKFLKDGQVEGEKIYATTSDSASPTWKIEASKFTMNEKTKFQTKDDTVKVFDTPLFWYPSFSMTASKKFKVEPTTSYRMFWEKRGGPLALFRQKIYDGEDLKVHWRGEYRLKHGAGTALELDYKDSKGKRAFQSRNFYAYDSFLDESSPYKYKSRYRIQGIAEGQSGDKKMEGFARWDVLSDERMRQDFPTQLFELKTLERTEVHIKGRYDIAYTSLYGRPRVNGYQGFLQELPTLKIAMKPLLLGKSGILFDNYFKVGYLDYAYSNSLAGAVNDFHSSRFETQQRLIRPFRFSSLHITPEVSYHGIFYGNNPHDHSILQGVINYGIKSHMTLQKSFGSITHHMEPYFTFQGNTRPTANIDDVWIFSSQDAFHPLHQSKLGIKNLFYQPSWSRTLPRFEADASLYAFPLISPKTELALSWNYPKARFGTRIGWNIEQSSLDYLHCHFAYTWNEAAAFSLELRNRGNYEFRKSDHQNFILEVARPLNELLSSPLSDPRTTLLARWHLRFAPLFSLQIQNMVGLPSSGPLYHESRIDLLTILSNRWQLRLGYTRAVKTNLFSFDINLL